MGRGLSEQQRAILALARAFNATQNGGVPDVVAFDFHIPPGGQLAGGSKTAVAELAWAPRLPDYTQPFGLAVLDGFKRHPCNVCQWNPATVCRKRQMSMARAVVGLLDRGMLCHAMDPSFVMANVLPKDTVLRGWGGKYPCGGDAAPEPLRRFWVERDRPAYWLTAAGHDAAGPMWECHDAAAIVATHMDVCRVWRRGGRWHEWTRYTTPEAEAVASKSISRLKSRGLVWTGRADLRTGQPKAIFLTDEGRAVIAKELDVPGWSKPKPPTEAEAMESIGRLAELLKAF